MIVNERNYIFEARFKEIDCINIIDLDLDGRRMKYTYWLFSAIIAINSTVLSAERRMNG